MQFATVGISPQSTSSAKQETTAQLVIALNQPKTQIEARLYVQKPNQAAHFVKSLAIGKWTPPYTRNVRLASLQQSTRDSNTLLALVTWLRSGKLIRVHLMATPTSLVVVGARQPTSARSSSSADASLFC
jgi:hypothetical protein